MNLVSLLKMRLVKHPVLCNYYLTYRCNATCDFCDIWEKPSPYVTLENFKSNLASLKKLKVKVIDFTGGEPLLHRELDVFCALAKEAGFITTVTTNALLYPKYAERLKGKVDMLHFSLDSVDEEKHNASRGVNCFGHIQESIRIAKELGERPDILFTVSNTNVHELPEAYDTYVLKLGLVLILNPIFGYNDINDRGGLNPASMDELRNFGKKKGVFMNAAFLKLREDGGNQISKPICKAGSSTIVISPHNELVVPCYHLGEKSFPIEDLNTLYRSEEVQGVVKKEGRLAACQGCDINCYMQPSFTVEVNKYWWSSVASTLKYNKMKGTWRALL